MEECQEQLRQEHGIEIHYFRIRALPFTEHTQGLCESMPEGLRCGAEPGWPMGGSDLPGGEGRAGKN